ncbi:MAG: hypothetical protein GWP08_03420 [Nitrospiraceae bacterium]|nr:hypothetical protein [Nitrospiraceae bacterium]
MSKKDKIELQHSELLDTFDSELTEAMKLLDETNERVSDVLGTFAPPDPDLDQAQTDPNADAAGAADDEPAPSDKPAAAADSTEEAGTSG